MLFDETTVRRVVNKHKKAQEKQTKPLCPIPIPKPVSVSSLWKALKGP